MKLSEILGWEKKICKGCGHSYSVSDIPIEAIDCCPDGLYSDKSFNTALTSCDREIDREALVEELKQNGRMLTYEEFADLIISTMPTWLKPTKNLFLNVRSLKMNVFNGGPAFPKRPHYEERKIGCPDFYGEQKGMYLRDYFAGQALVGLIINPHTVTTTAPLSVRAYEIADNMILERNRTND